jgi:hypothetical protein
MEQESQRKVAEGLIVGQTPRTGGSFAEAAHARSARQSRRPLLPLAPLPPASTEWGIDQAREQLSDALGYAAVVNRFHVVEPLVQ